MSQSFRATLPMVLVAVAIGVAVSSLFLLRRGENSPEDEMGALAPTRTNQQSDSSGAGRDHSPGFKDITSDAGIHFCMYFLPGEQGEKFKINLYDHGCGVVVGDYDGDGHDDILFLNQLGPSALYKNDGKGNFVDVTAESGVALADRICVGATFADFDNDGDQDLYVTSTRGGNVLFENLGNGRFQDITEKAGLICIAHSQTAAFFDYDNDGDLDLFVTNTAEWTTNEFDAVDHYFPGVKTFWQLGASLKEYNILYRNNGNGTFTDVTEGSGLRGKGWGGDVAVFDYDEDGRTDMFVTNMFGASQLYHNDGNGKFSDVTKKTLGRTSWGAIGSKAFDYNNDGHLDLLVVDMHSDMWMGYDYDLAKIEEKKKYRFVTGPTGDVMTEQRFADRFHINYDDVVFGNTLFKNLGGGKFEEVSDASNMETFWPWGIATGDFDNDGYEDVLLPSGMGFPFGYWGSYLMMNNGDGSFTDRARTEGVEPPGDGIKLKQQFVDRTAYRSSRCAATADFDGDGRLDLIVNNFNDHPFYLKNTFPRRNYVAFRLKATHSNPDAIGAVAKVYMGDKVMARQVHAAGGYLSQSSKTLHFGLGDHTAIDRVEIRWPSGMRQTVANPAVNVLHEITEPAASP